jgi:hypothetical protein
MTDPIPADQLLAVADALATPPLSLEHAAGLVKVLLTDARDLVDAELLLPTTPADNAMALLRLTSIGFHLDRALNELRHLTPARQGHSTEPAVGAPVGSTPGGPVKPDHWHEFLLPRDIRQS